MTPVASAVAADAKAPSVTQWPGPDPLHGLIRALRIHADGAAEELPLDRPGDPQLRDHHGLAFRVSPRG